VVGWSSGGSGRADAFTPEVEVIISTIAGTVVARLGLPNPSASFGNIVRVHWTPDGRSVVLSRVSGAPDGGRTWLVPLDGGAASAFPVEPAYASNGIFSPDGSLVVGVAFERLVIAAADGSAIRPLVAPKDLPDEGIGTNPTWSPDGHLIAIGLGDGFTLVDVATGGVRHIWSPPPSPDPSISYASYVTGWSADGERLLVETYDPVSRGLWSVSIDGSDPQRLVAGEVVGGSWQWSPPES
jgi:Tol biopolymer transport system component